MGGAAKCEIRTAITEARFRAGANPVAYASPSDLPDSGAASKFKRNPSRQSIVNEGDYGDHCVADRSADDMAPVKNCQVRSDRRVPRTRACDLEPLLTVEDTAQILNVSPKTIRRLIASGSIGAVRIGRSVRIRCGDLVALIGNI